MADSSSSSAEKAKAPIPIPTVETACDFLSPLDENDENVGGDGRGQNKPKEKTALNGQSTPIKKATYGSVEVSESGADGDGSLLSEPALGSARNRHAMTSDSSQTSGSPVKRRPSRQRSSRSRSSTSRVVDRKTSTRARRDTYIPLPVTTYVSATYAAMQDDYEDQMDKSMLNSTLSQSGNTSAAEYITGEGEGDLTESYEMDKNDLPPLTSRQLITMVMLAFASFASTVAFSCIAPFFPGEAEQKGLSQTTIGLIFSCFELVMFIVSPFMGRYISVIGSKFMFVCGLFTTGSTAILFGLLKWSPPGTTFLLLCFCVRIVESIGASSFMTASFAITAHEFPGRVATVIGIIETFNGMGFAAGPPIGGAFFELGGYTLPFLVLGCMLLITAVIAFFVLPSFSDLSDEERDTRGVIGLLRIPSVLLMGLAIASCATALTFIDPTLEPHLADFNLSPAQVGLMFLVSAGTYTVLAPIWGYVVDHSTLSPLFMVCGAVLGVFSLLLIGPSPILPLPKSLWVIIVGLSLMGMAVGALFIPTFNSTLEIARAKGYPDNFTTYGCVSGFFQGCFSFGGFFGPTFGGFAMEKIGFPWTATIIAALFALVAVLLAVFNGFTNKCRLVKTPQKGRRPVTEVNQSDEAKLVDNEVVPARLDV